MEEFFNKLRDMQGVVRLDLSLGSDINPKEHINVIVSRMYCTGNEIEEVQRMLRSQYWFEWSFEIVP